MRALTIGIAVAMALGLTSVVSEAQTWKPPADSQRCPSKWGAGDERGSANHMKPETVLQGDAADQAPARSSRSATC